VEDPPSLDELERRVEVAEREVAELKVAYARIDEKVDSMRHEVNMIGSVVKYVVVPLLVLTLTVVAALAAR
jgi:hypothetical protein